MKNLEISSVLDVKYNAYLFEKVFFLSLHHSLETKQTHSTSCCNSDRLYKLEPGFNRKVEFCRLNSNFVLKLKAKVESKQGTMDQ